MLPVDYSQFTVAEEVTFIEGEKKKKEVLSCRNTI